MKFGSFLLALGVGWLLSCSAGAEQYSVPGLGMLTLDVPKNWRVQDKPGPVSVYLRIRPESGDAFVLQLTSTWMPRDKLASMSAETIKGRVESMAKDLLPKAVETEAPLRELKGKEVAGYYFSVTGREPLPDPKAYKYLTQGMLSNSVGTTVFTLLYREPGIAELQQTLEMLSGAMHSSDRQVATPLARDAVRVSDGEQWYELWVPASRLYVIIPRGRLTPVKNPLGGAASNPRYFYFVDRVFNVSGWFEPADKFSGMQKFWEEEMRGWKQQGLPAPVDVVFAKLGGWDAVIYDSPSPLGNNSHIRAHWVQAGTWVDIHLSLTSNASSAQIRSALEGFLKGVFVRER